MSVAQLCPTLCHPMDCSPPGSSVHEIFQARILEWVAISFSRGSSQPRDQTWVSCIAGRFFTIRTTGEVLANYKNKFCLTLCFKYTLCLPSYVRLFATLWTTTPQVPLSIGFSRQEYWRGLPFPSPEDLSNSRIKSGWVSCTACRFFTD